MSRKNVSLNFLKRRRSIRKYLSRKVPPELIDLILETARWAPSAHNAQPWRFFVLSKPQMKEKLAREMAERFRKDLEKDGIPKELARDRAEISFDRFSASPVIIIACLDMGQMDRYPDHFRQKAEKVMATQSLAAAIQTLLLSASALGLGGCWYCAPLFCPEVVKKAIDLPDHWIPQALITLGYPDEVPVAPQRLPLDEIRKIL
ncbi:MAG: nitroreductase family protein [Thermodesulfobacteriota bacterium]